MMTTKKKSEGDGGGLMVHPMFRKMNEDWHDIQKRSFNFGWKGHSPKEE